MTRARDPTLTLLVSLAAGIGAVATSYAVSGFTPTFVASPIERFLSWSMPGEIVLFMIDTFGSLGQQFNLLTATVLAVVLFGGLAAFGIAVGQRVGAAAFAVATTVGAGWLVAATLTGSALESAGVGIGAGIVVGASEMAGHNIGGTASIDPDRRKLLASTVTALGLGALGLGSDTLRAGSDGTDQPQNESASVDAVDINQNRSQSQETIAEEQPVSASEDEIAVSEYMRQARDNSLDVPGIEPLLSENFYNVDINAVDPEVDREDWTLSVTGAVENEFEIGFEELQGYRAENRMVTLRCVGDGLNGKKVDNAVWTGIPVDPLLERAGVENDSCCVMLRADDGFFEEFPLEALRGSLLAYGMNGQTLPRAHGYPLRALIPGHWGEVNVKWLTEIEILEEEAKGYWEQRGWHGTGPVNTVAKLWDEGIVRHDDGRVTLAGHAYAGTRGIERVEVSTDGGDSWSEATLTEPLPGEDIWRQWSYEYEPNDTHDVVVRAVDGNGDIQTEEENDPIPSGATGWVRKTISA